MWAYFVRRFLLVIPTFLGITIVVFFIMHFVPGGPVERQIMRLRMARHHGGGAAGRWTVRRRAAAGGHRPDSAVLRIRQAGARPLRTMALECGAPRPGQFLHLSGSRLGRHQVALPDFNSSRPDRLRAELPRLRPARRVQSRQTSDRRSISLQRAGFHGLCRAWLGAGNGAAGAVRRRQFLERIPARWIPVRTTGNI